MFEILSSSIEKAIELIGNLGYPGVFYLSFLDRLTVFLIPAEIVLPAFGVLISREVFGFWPVFIWMNVGSFLGNIALYLVFLKGGRSFLENYGRYFLISRHELSHLDQWFSRYGDKLVLIGYLVPTSVRSLVPIFAGISLMKFSKFFLYTAIGFLPLNLLYIFIGIKAGDNLSVVLGYFEKVNYLVIVAIAILVLWYIYRHTIGKHLTHR